MAPRSLRPAAGWSSGVVGGRGGAEAGGGGAGGGGGSSAAGGGGGLRRGGRLDHPEPGPERGGRISLGLVLGRGHPGFSLLAGGGPNRSRASDLVIAALRIGSQDGLPSQTRLRVPARFALLYARAPGAIKTKGEGWVGRRAGAGGPRWERLVVGGDGRPAMLSGSGLSQGAGRARRQPGSVKAMYLARKPGLRDVAQGLTARGNRNVKFKTFS